MQKLRLSGIEYLTQACLRLTSATERLESEQLDFDHWPSEEGLVPSSDLSSYRHIQRKHAGGV